MLLAAALLAAQTPKKQDNSVPVVTAYCLDRTLTDREAAKLHKIVAVRGVQRVENAMTEDHRLLVLKSSSGRVSGIISSALASLGKEGPLHPVPVQKRGQELVVDSGLYLVYFDRGIEESESAKSLLEAKFEILDRPSKLLPAYRVRRTKDPSGFTADLKDLQTMAGVKLAASDSLTLILK